MTLTKQQCRKLGEYLRWTADSWASVSPHLPQAATWAAEAKQFADIFESAVSASVETQGPEEAVNGG
jgi:hypothetical protein